MYEDAISSLEDTKAPPLPGVKPPVLGKYGEIINGMDGAAVDTAQATAFTAGTSNPDKAAEALEISKKLGVPAQAVEANPKQFQDQVRATENAATLKAHPVLAQWIAANPEAARVAHDDFQNMGFLTKAIHAARSGWNQGTLQDSLARENTKQLLTAGGEIKETDRERELRKQMSLPDGVDGGFYDIVKHMSSFLSGLGSQVKGAAVPAIGGATVGSAVPGVGTGGGAVAGFTAGMVKEGFETGAGQIYSELKNLKDADGAPIDPTIVKGASITGGIALGFLNALNVQYMNKPFVDAMKSVIPSLAKKTLERPTVAAALGQFGKNMAKGGLVGAEFGLMSQVISSGSTELAKHFDSPEKWQTIFNSEAQREKVLEQIVDSMESTALAFSVLHAPPASLSMGMDIARARRAVQDQEFIKSLADGSAASKVRDRSPSMFENFISSQTEGTPVEHLYLPAEVVMKLYQDAGIDPKDRGTDHLFPFQADMGTQLEQALPVKGDVIIRTADYATHLAGTEVDKVLRKDLKVGPDSMSVNDAKLFFQDVQKELGERAKDLKNENSKPEEAGDKIKADVQKQLEEAGYKPRTAGGMAAQMAAFFQTIGKRLGMDPMAIFEKYGLKVERKEGETPAGAMETGGLEQAYPKSKVQERLYHGTAFNVKKFDPEKIGWFADLSTYGFYMHTDPEVASAYAGGAHEMIHHAAPGKEPVAKGTKNRPGANVIPVHADIRNPLYFTLEQVKKEGYEDATNFLDDHIHEWQLNGLLDGKDGIVVEDPEGGKLVVVPGNPKQIRSALSGKFMQSAKAYDKLSPKAQEYAEAYFDYRRTGMDHFEAMEQTLTDASPKGEEAGAFPSNILTAADHSGLNKFLHGLGESEVADASKFDQPAADAMINAAIDKAGETKFSEVSQRLMLESRAKANAEGKPYGEQERQAAMVAAAHEIMHPFPESAVKEVVYHGTTRDFDKFDRPSHGVYFLEDQFVAGHVYGNRGPGGGGKTTVPVYLDIRNPYRATEVDNAHILADEYVAVSKMIKKAKAEGHDGISFDLGLGQGESWVAFENTPIQNAGTGKMMQKEGKEPPRGYIHFGNDRKVSIALLEKADLSTFLHESGHMYLEVLRDFATPGTALEADAQSIFKYLGVKSWKEVGKEQHENFARSFEAYLMEGVAPSRELKGVFQRFKNWLTTIYGKITSLDVNLAPEVRQVFDRMLATDEEIMAARRAQRLEALFTDAKSAGMTDAEYAAYRRAVNRVTEDADAKLLNKTMEDVRRTRTKEWKAEERQVRDEELKKVDARPDISALHFLRTGEMLDGKKDIPAMRLSRKALEDTYGADILADLPRGRPGRPLVVDKDGVHPDDVAQLFGYPSGDAMVKGLIALERKYRREQAKGNTQTIRNILTDEATERRMKKEHGDMLDDGSIRDEAMNVLHSTGQAEVLATELRALSRTQKDSRPLPLSVARDWAKSVVEGRTVQEATKYFRYARDEAKAARAVMKAFVAGDQAEAMRQKQLQLLNHVLYMEAKNAADDIGVSQRRLDGYASAKVLRSVDPDYLDQVHQLLERFDFATASDKEVERRESLAKWITRTEADGNEVKIDDKLRSEAFRKHFSKLTVSEFRGLTDAADNIIHIGKLKNQLMDLGQKRDLFEVVADAVAQVSQLRTIIPPEQRNPGVGGKGLDRLEAKYLKLKSGLKSMDAALLKMEQVFDWLDSGDSNGAFNRVVFKRIADAGIVEHDLRQQIAESLRKLNRKMPKDFFKDFNNRYEVSELTDSRTGKASQMLKSEILAMALNVGNLSNFDKLLRGEKWSESAVKAVLDRHMSKADWEFVQGVWDSVGGLWPKIAELEKRLTGVAPEKVEAREVETPHGNYKGGYYPVVYDPLRSWDVELNRQRTADELFERQYMRATTQHGHTTERVQPYARPLYLSMDVLPRHLQQVTHDLAYREAIMDADKFLSNPKIRKAVEETLGREVYTQFRPWLQAIANDKVFDQRGLAWWDKAAHWARTSGTMVGLGFRFTTMLIHGATAASNSIGELGPKWMLSGMNSFFGTPEKMAAARDFVFERSGEMRHRMNDVDRDVRDGLSELEGKQGVTYAARRFAYYGISALDMASALPTWMGAYNKALAGGMGEEQAIYAADKSVRVAHGGGHIKDLPAVQRGTEWQKLFTMFYSFWSHFYNRQRHMGRQLVEAGHELAEGDYQGAAKDFSMVLSRSLFYFIIPQMIHATLRTKGKTDEDKSWLHLAAEEVGMGLFAGVPVLRDIAHSVFLGRDYEATPAAQIVKSFLASGKDLAAAAGATDSEVSDKWVRHAMETAGYTFGLPLGQPAGTAQFLWDVIHGDQDPQGVTDWMHGVIYGKLPQGG